MFDFFDSANFTNVTLEESLNMVQCLEELIVPPISGQQRRTQHATPLEQMHHDPEIYREPAAGPAPDRRRIYEDDDTDGEGEHPHL